MPKLGLILRMVLITNLLLWTWFWIDVGINLVPFVPQAPEFEREIAAFRFGNSVLPSGFPQDSAAFKTMLYVQNPTFYLCTKLANVISSGSWDKPIGFLSIGSLHLVASTLLSFLQWYWIAVLFQRAIARLAVSRRRGAITPVF
jgi:hypothetical protein